MKSIVERVAEIPCVRSRKLADTLIRELGARGLYLAEAPMPNEGERGRLRRLRESDWPARAVHCGADMEED